MWLMRKVDTLYLVQAPDTNFNSYKAGLENYYLTVRMFKYVVTLEQFDYILKRLYLTWGRFMRQVKKL